MMLRVHDTFGDIIDHQRDYAAAIDTATMTGDLGALEDLAAACRTELVAEARRQQDARLLYRVAMTSLAEAWTHDSARVLVNGDTARAVRAELEVLRGRGDVDGLAHEAMAEWYRLFDHARAGGNVPLMGRLARVALAELCAYEACIDAGITPAQISLLGAGGEGR
ncbi:hypothetical protein [Nonomuraea ceibae]|uniref:hypothetical protein n=1 Tax=Nonomuraea ceibae TaxID=1935170 RepID=UPI001C5CF894|nr:hypothetical protein [Nonomuraea ceibae]